MRLYNLETAKRPNDTWKATNLNAYPRPSTLDPSNVPNQRPSSSLFAATQVFWRSRSQARAAEGKKVRGSCDSIVDDEIYQQRKAGQHFVWAVLEAGFGVDFMSPWGSDDDDERGHVSMHLLSEPAPLPIDCEMLLEVASIAGQHVSLPSRHLKLGLNYRRSFSFGGMVDVQRVMHIHAALPLKTRPAAITSHHRSCTANAVRGDDARGATTMTPQHRVHQRRRVMTSSSGNDNRYHDMMTMTSSSSGDRLHPPASPALPPPSPCLTLAAITSAAASSPSRLFRPLSCRDGGLACARKALGNGSGYQVQRGAGFLYEWDTLARLPCWTQHLEDSHPPHSSDPHSSLHRCYLIARCSDGQGMIMSRRGSLSPSRTAIKPADHAFSPPPTLVPHFLALLVPTTTPTPLMSPSLYPPASPISRNGGFLAVFELVEAIVALCSCLACLGALTMTLQLWVQRRWRNDAAALQPRHQRNDGLASMLPLAAVMREAGGELRAGKRARSGRETAANRWRGGGIGECLQCTHYRVIMIYYATLWSIPAYYVGLSAGAPAGISRVVHSRIFQEFWLKLGESITQSVLNGFAPKKLQNFQKIQGYKVNTTTREIPAGAPALSPNTMAVLWSTQHILSSAAEYPPNTMENCGITGIYYGALGIQNLKIIEAPLHT
ncbi:hypothetical protein BDZ97DRAFT_1952885 [Flammula alnicola]|nr:hypothetical protein BDZ97DRAFT_1952885 [Flammula alnicola]